MTPDRVKQLRQRAGLTLDGLAAALRMGHDGRRRVRAWESGKTPITGPASVALEALASGWKADEPRCPGCLGLGGNPACGDCADEQPPRSFEARGACPACKGDGELPACRECGVVWEVPF